MTAATPIVIVMIALLHVYFLVLEMFFWDKPLGLRAFKLTPDFAKASKKLAANQGLYNGFLAAGLLWGLWRNDIAIQAFFLYCVLVAGLFGAATVGKKVLFVQALPAAIGLMLLHI